MTKSPNIVIKLSVSHNLGFKVLCEKFENEKKKRTNFFFDLPERGFEPKIFSNFPAYNSNFHGK